MGRSYLLLVFLITVCISCIKDNDNEECPEIVTIHLEYNSTSQNKGLTDILQVTDLFLFNENEGFIKRYNYNRSQSLNQSGIALGKLPAGKYKLVTWLNLSANTKVDPVEQSGLANLKVHDAENSNFNHTTSDPLFHNTISFEVKEKTNTDVYVPLRREYCTAKVIITGLPQQVNPSLGLTGASAAYDFLGTIISDNQLHSYTPVLNQDTKTGGYYASFNLFRPKMSDSLKLRLFDNNTQQTIYDLDLSKVLKELGIDTEKDNDVDFEINLGFTSGILSIKVNDWYMTEDIIFAFI